MQVRTQDELRVAMVGGAGDIVVADPELSARIRSWNTKRLVLIPTLGVLSFFMLLAWIDALYRQPAGIYLNMPSDLTVILRWTLLFLWLAVAYSLYRLPVVRRYRIAGDDASGLKLALRRREL